MTLGAFDLFEGLDVFVLWPVHDGENFRDKMLFIAGPMATCASIKRFQKNRSSGWGAAFLKHRLGRSKL